MSKFMTNIPDQERDDINKIFTLAATIDLDDLHVKFDNETGLQAIIAIHDTTYGPALGGCRLAHYASTGAALIDAIRLARGMTMKSVLADIPQGGGKAVMMKPITPFDRRAYFEKFGEFVNELGGRYITAVDSGTEVHDMNIVATKTPYVSCTGANLDDSIGNPSPHTADGVIQAIKAAVKFQLNRDNLEGIHIAIQGVGSVGFQLAEKAHKLGAKLTISDVNQFAVEQCAAKTQATIVSSDDIFSVPCDVFAPCALGSVINANTLKQLRCKIVTGAANNQLQEHCHGEALRQLGILYTPDYVANSGGLIYASLMYNHGNVQLIQQKIDNIYNTCMEIYQRANNQATNDISALMAEERLLKKKREKK